MQSSAGVIPGGTEKIRWISDRSQKKIKKAVDNGRRLWYIWEAVAKTVKENGLM